MLVELSRRCIALPKHEEPTLLWQNCAISVCSLKQLTCFELTCDFNFFERKINVVESNITCTNNSPVSSSLLRQYVKQGIKNVELTEMIMDPTFWPYSELIIQEMVKIISFEWSPPNIMFNYRRLLAVVNSCGNVDLYYLKQNNLSHVMNFSDTLRNHLQPDVIVVPNEFNEIRNIAYNLATSAVCWASQVDQEKSCCFVTSQKSGEIIFWRIKSANEEVHAEFLGSFKGSKTEVEKMVWVKNNYNMFLICANKLGQIIIYEYKLNRTIKLIKEIVIWEHEDKMVAKHMYYINYKDKIILIYSKHRHIVIQLFDKNFKLLSQYVKIINDFKIMSIVKCADDFYVGTFNTKIYKVSYKIVNNDINISIDNILYKDSSSSHELYGLGVSENNSLFAAALIDRQVFCRKECSKIEIVFLKLENSYQQDINMILNNPSKQLTNAWDLLEVIRYNIFKTKNIPDINYENLFLEGSSDIYKMKVYLALLIFHNNLKSSKTVHFTHKLPELSIEKVKEDILFLHAVNILHSIYNKQHMDNLSNFKLECFYGARKFVFYYCKKYKRDLSVFITNDILNWSQSAIEYTCQSCDEKIEEFSCKSGHLNLFCVLSFTPIEGHHYLTCKTCKILARPEFYDFEPKCVYCDSYLNFYETI